MKKHVFFISCFLLLCIQCFACVDINTLHQELSTLKHRWKNHPRLASIPMEWDEGTLILLEEGSGSTYLLYDADHRPCYIIKPIDESAHCLHARISNSVCTQTRLRKHIPLHQSPQTEALCYQIAKHMGLESLLPETHLIILSHDLFNTCEHPLCDKEKLCSIQTYLPHHTNLHVLARLWFEQGYTDSEVQLFIDEKEFALLNLLTWLLYDTDAHGANYLAQLGEDNLYHLVKIDNGLALPTENHALFNALFFLPQATTSPPPYLLEILESIDLNYIKFLFEEFALQASYPSFLERFYLIKSQLENNPSSFRVIEQGLLGEARFEYLFIDWVS